MPPNLRSAVEKAFRTSDKTTADFVPMSIFPDHYEPEAKFNIGSKLKGFRTIRKMLADNKFDLSTSVVAGTIKNTNDASLNIIVEPFFENDHDTPLFEKHGKFLRIAGRIQKNGNIKNIKIALKCLSGHEQIMDGLPYRQEFEPPLPENMKTIDKLPEALEWFWKKYEETYNDNKFSHITAQNLRPTSAYVTNRTRYHFLKELPEKSLILECEGCEDLFLCLGSDIETPLSDFKNAEGQFEWEVLGAYALNNEVIFDDHEKQKIGLSTMQKMLKKIIETLRPYDNWIDFASVESKAEISRRMTFNHPNFMWPHEKSDIKNDFQDKVIRHRYVLDHSRPVLDILNDKTVKNALARFGHHLVKRGRQYNDKMRPDLKLQLPVQKN